MGRLFFISLIFVASFSSCNKCKVAIGTTSCIKKNAKEFCKSESCESAFVGEYSFQGERVYAFHPGNCGADMTSEVLDENCNRLGLLGGIAGNTIINGEEFSNATLQRVVWEKTDN